MASKDPKDVFVEVIQKAGYDAAYVERMPSAYVSSPEDLDKTVAAITKLAKKNGYCCSFGVKVKQGAKTAPVGDDVDSADSGDTPGDPVGIGSGSGIEGTGSGDNPGDPVHFGAGNAAPENPGDPVVPGSGNDYDGMLLTGAMLQDFD